MGAHPFARITLEPKGTGWRLTVHYRGGSAAQTQAADLPLLVRQLAEWIEEDLDFFEGLGSRPHDG